MVNWSFASTSVSVLSSLMLGKSFLSFGSVPALSSSSSELMILLKGFLSAVEGSDQRSLITLRLYLNFPISHQYSFLEHRRRCIVWHSPRSQVVLVYPNTSSLKILYILFIEKLFDFPNVGKCKRQNTYQYLPGKSKYILIHTW